MVSPAIVPVPPFGSYVTLYVFAVHCACAVSTSPLIYVVSPHISPFFKRYFIVPVGCFPSSYQLPPFMNNPFAFPYSHSVTPFLVRDIYQPLNVYPVRVNVFSDDFIPPNQVCVVSAIVPVPPFASYLIVHFIAVQCAYSVVVVVIFTVVSSVICVPPVADVNQPANVYPVFVAVASVPYFPSYVTVLLLADAVPPFASYVIVYVFAIHCAYSVVSFVIFTVESFVICVPPVVAVNQPLNVYPSLVGVGKSPYVKSYVTFLFDVVVFPPFVSNVTLYVFAVHCAYTVIVALLFIVNELVICVPPVFDVNQPFKLYPVLVATGNVPISLSTPTSLDVSLTVPPFGSNFTVYLSFVQCAYSVTSFCSITEESAVINVPPVESVNQPSNP